MSQTNPSCDSDNGTLSMQTEQLGDTIQSIEDDLAQISKLRTPRRKRKPNKITADAEIEENEDFPLSLPSLLHVYTCDFCDKVFKNKGSLSLHLRTHTGYRPHICSECGKSFCQIGALQTHSRIHTGDRPYKCKECDKSFNQLTGLNQHLRTHDGQQPYECDICNKRFSQNGSLTSHKRTHSGEKPFCCIECGRCFTQRGSLQSHVRTHTFEKPFKCDQCPKAFTQKVSLQQHLKTHKVIVENNFKPEETSCADNGGCETQVKDDPDNTMFPFDTSK